MSSIEDSKLKEEEGTIVPISSARRPTPGSVVRLDRPTKNVLPPRPGTAKEILADIVAKGAARRETRAAGKLDKMGLQAMLDTLRDGYEDHFPRVLVTDRALNTFRKRAAEARVDIKKFLAFILPAWADISGRTNWGLDQRRQRGEDVGSAQPMPRTPDFTTLSFRFPLFLRYYNDKIAGNYRAANDHKTTALVAESQDEIARLKRALAASQQEVANVRNLRQRAPLPAYVRPSVNPRSRYAVESETGDDE